MSAHSPSAVADEWETIAVEAGPMIGSGAAVKAAVVGIVIGAIRAAVSADVVAIVGVMIGEAVEGVLVAVMAILSLSTAGTRLSVDSVIGVAVIVVFASWLRKTIELP